MWAQRGAEYGTPSVAAPLAASLLFGDILAPFNILVSRSGFMACKMKTQVLYRRMLVLDY